jgi:hypothetical protein
MDQLFINDKSTAEKILDALERHLVPEINDIHKRAMFNTNETQEVNLNNNISIINNQQVSHEHHGPYQEQDR